MGEPPLITVSAWLWNGNDKLAGSLELTQDRLRFQLNDFPESHLQMDIALRDIRRVETFVIFGFARLGLEVYSAHQQSDRFILENLKDFYQKLQRQLRLISKKSP
jgi:hypothetical protein